MSQKCCTFRYGILWFDLLADLIRNNALMGCAPSLSFLSSVEIVTSQVGEERNLSQEDEERGVASRKVVVLFLTCVDNRLQSIFCPLPVSLRCSKAAIIAP